MTNAEFEALMTLTKVFSRLPVKLPVAGISKIYNIESTSSDDKFFLDVDRRGKIELSKYKIQQRYAISKLPLVRIDINSPPHTNPDGSKISRNHIHIYKEVEFDTGNLPWAYELNSISGFSGMPVDFISIFHGFCGYCNILTDNIQGVI